MKGLDIGFVRFCRAPDDAVASAGSAGSGTDPQPPAPPAPVDPQPVDPIEALQADYKAKLALLGVVLVGQKRFMQALPQTLALGEQAERARMDCIKSIDDTLAALNA